MSGGRLYTIRVRVGARVYVGRSMLGIEPNRGDVIEYAGAVRVKGADEPVEVDLELEVIRRRIPVAGGAPVIDAGVTGGKLHDDAVRELEALRFTAAQP